MTDTKLVPADDEAFRLNGATRFNGLTYEGIKDIEVWARPSGDFTSLAVNLDIGYITNKGHSINTNIDMAPEDAERLGVLLQFAAREVMQRRVTDA